MSGKQQDKRNSTEKEKFEEAKNKILGANRERRQIGTLGEKTLHAILKNYYEPDEDKQEIPIERYVADIYTGKEIIEIQTAQFNRMRDKLSVFLKEYPVTIIHPIAETKWLYWIDEETGEISEKRKSPKKGNPYSIFTELYKIKSFLKDPNLRIMIVMMDMEEYKLLNGWGKHKKNNASKYDRVPLSITKEILLERKEDYLQFVPYDLQEPFNVKDFAKAAKIPKETAGVVLQILHFLKIVKRVGKQGNAFLYEVMTDN